MASSNRIALAGIEPTIWRRVLVPASFSLHDLHRVIQKVFGWLDYHLYSFTIGGESFEAPDEEATGRDATKIPLSKLSVNAGDAFTYTYDFGDDWVHEVSVLARHPRDPEAVHPSCIDGARAGPPEDCGGPPGYEDLLRSLADPTDPEFLVRRAWVGAHFHPETFDLRATNRILMLAFAGGVG